MHKPLAWSHSVMNSFETCAKRHYLTKVIEKEKRVADPMNPEGLWGRRVHKHLENRCKGTEALPPELEYMEPVVRRILTYPGQRLIEKQFAIDISFTPAGWFDKSVWCRGIVDIGLVGTRGAFLGDWKTGKRKPDSDQMMLMAALAFVHYPFLEEVTTTFIWLKEKKLDSEKFTRTQVSDIWNLFLPRVTRLELALKEDKWPAQPSGLCGKWCPITKKDCPFGK